MSIAALQGWTSEQKHVVAAAFLGWSLDAFDFFLLVFVLKDIAAEFNTDITVVTFAILLTLAMRKRFEGTTFSALALSPKPKPAS